MYVSQCAPQRPDIPDDCPRHWPAVIEAGWKQDEKVTVPQCLCNVPQLPNAGVLSSQIPWQ